MINEINPYTDWLGLANASPPNHYELLGIIPFESSRLVIEKGAKTQAAAVKPFLESEHQAIANRILNEILLAKLCLLEPNKKAVYDRKLQQEGLTLESFDRTKPTIQPNRPNVSSSDQHKPESSNNQNAHNEPPKVVDHKQKQPPPRQATIQEDASLAKIRNPNSPLTAVPNRGVNSPQTGDLLAPTRQVKRGSLLPMVFAILATAGLFVFCVAGSVFAFYFVSQNNGLSTSSNLDQSVAKKGLGGPMTKKPTEQPDKASGRVQKNRPNPKSTTGNDKPIRDPSIIDLLALIDPSKNRVTGSASKINGELIFPSDKKVVSRVQIPLSKIPKRYKITAEVVRLSGNDGLIFGLNNNGNSFSGLIDGFPNNGSFTGFNMNHGATVNAPRRNKTSKKGRRLMIGKKSIVEILVANNDMLIKVDGSIAAEFSGNPSTLSLRSHMHMPNQPPLFIASWQCGFRISRLELKPL